MPPRPRPEDDRTLYWNDHGARACLAHAPGRGTDTWKWERWREVRPTDLAELAKHGIASCETCEGKRARERAALLNQATYEKQAQILLAFDDGREVVLEGLSTDFVLPTGEISPFGQNVASELRRLRGEDR